MEITIGSCIEFHEIKNSNWSLFFVFKHVSFIVYDKMIFEWLVERGMKHTQKWWLHNMTDFYFIFMIIMVAQLDSEKDVNNCSYPMRFFDE
jgi:hypothetical protein